MNSNISRRKLLLTAAAAAPATLIPVKLMAAEKLDVADPQAKALGYVEDASAVDAAAWPKFKPEQNCANCALYTGEPTGYGACSIFAGKEVAAAGWCNVWAPKP
jgi:hypothetical protein